MNMKRREFIQYAAMAAGLTVIPMPIQSLLAKVPGMDDAPTIIYVFLRGGSDSLALLPPASVSTLKKFRPDEFIYAEKTKSHTSNDVIIHPDLKPLMAYKKDLAFVFNTGSINETRSHFTQMDYIESGSSKLVQKDGFFSRFLTELKSSDKQMMAIGGKLPFSLRGSDSLLLSSKGDLSSNLKYTGAEGVVTSPFNRNQRLDLLKSTSGTIKKAAQSAQEKLAAMEKDIIVKGTADTVFANQMLLAAELVNSVHRPAAIAMDCGSWDTHFQQGPADGGYATQVKALVSGLLAFRQNVSAKRWKNTTIVVMSEFGRTVKVNANKGTDHGRGGAMIVMGGQVNPNHKGRRSWDLPDTADSSTALKVVHDYRVILAEIFNKQFGLKASAISSIFAGEIGNLNGTIDIIKKAA